MVLNTGSKTSADSYRHINSRRSVTGTCAVSNYIKAKISVIVKEVSVKICSSCTYLQRVRRFKRKPYIVIGISMPEKSFIYHAQFQRIYFLLKTPKRRNLICGHSGKGGNSSQNIPPIVPPLRNRIKFSGLLPAGFFSNAVKISLRAFYKCSCPNSNRRHYSESLVNLVFYA